jgi:hydroxyacylglutathione hydrolase
MTALHREREAGDEAGTLLDVRQPVEWRTGVVDDSAQIFVADLQRRLGELPKDEPITVFCRTGHRASMAASVLSAAGFQLRILPEGGAASWPEPLVRTEAPAR